MSVITPRRKQENDLAEFQNDLTKILKERKGEDQEDEVYHNSCISTLYI